MLLSKSCSVQLKTSQHRQNHATYPGTLSALRAPNFETMISENKEKTAKIAQSGSCFTLFHLNYIKIISVSIWIL